MAMLRRLSKSEGFLTYLQTVGLHAGVHVNNCVSAGLPGVWLYMKALGLEQEFFAQLKRCENRPAQNKELMYLLFMTNSNSEFFPQLPDTLLKLEIPGLVLDAQVEITQPDFKLVFVAARDRLLELLRDLLATTSNVTSSNRMIRIGSKDHAVGIMYQNGKYSVYHEANETKALDFEKLPDCVDMLLKMLPKSKHHEGVMVVLETFNLVGMPVPKPPIAAEFFLKYCKQYSDTQLTDCLFTCVLANDISSLQYLRKMNVSFAAKKLGIDLLQLAVTQVPPNPAIIKLLVEVGVERHQAIEDMISKKAHQKSAAIDEVLHLLRAESTPHPFISSINAPPSQRKSSPSNH